MDHVTDHGDEIVNRQNNSLKPRDLRRRPVLAMDPGEKHTFETL